MGIVVLVSTPSGIIEYLLEGIIIGRLARDSRFGIITPDRTYYNSGLCNISLSGRHCQILGSCIYNGRSRALRSWLFRGSLRHCRDFSCPCNLRRSIDNYYWIQRTGIIPEISEYNNDDEK